MRILWLFLVFATVLAWTSEELEIFELNHQLKDTKFDDFYHFMNLTSNASYKQINKQFKKLSVKYHPDKITKGRKGLSMKKATKQYQFFQSIANVLRTPSLKERYDYYLSNGFPKYRNNRWGFHKFKPGLTMVIVFLYLLIGVAHVVILKINYRQQVNKLKSLMADITEYNDKLKQEQQQSQVFSDNKIDWIGQNFLVRFDGSIYLETGEDQYVKVTTDDIPKPRFVDGFLIKLPVLIYNLTIGKISESLRVNLAPNEIKPQTLNTNEKPKPKKKAPKGEKLRLPNGKVVYSKNK